MNITRREVRAAQRLLYAAWALLLVGPMVTGLPFWLLGRRDLALHTALVPLWLLFAAGAWSYLVPARAACGRGADLVAAGAAVVIGAVAGWYAGWQAAATAACATALVATWALAVGLHRARVLGFGPVGAVLLMAQALLLPWAVIAIAVSWWMLDRADIGREHGATWYWLAIATGGALVAAHIAVAWFAYRRALRVARCAKH